MPDDERRNPPGRRSLDEVAWTVRDHDRILNVHDSLLVGHAAQLTTITSRLSLIEGTVNRVETTLGGDKVLGTPGALEIINDKLDDMRELSGKSSDRTSTVLLTIFSAIVVIAAAFIGLFHH